MIDGIDVFKYIVAFIFVIGLMYLLAYIVRYFGYGSMPLRKIGEKRRLSISEILPIDAKHKLLIVKCDEKEHLVLTGTTNDLIIDSNIKPSASSLKKREKVDG